jgi:hypothetical protein
MLDINRPLELADELIGRLTEETDNQADLLGGIALAIRRMQGYQDYVLLTFNPTLRRYKTKEEELEGYEGRMEMLGVDADE